MIGFYAAGAMGNDGPTPPGGTPTYVGTGAGAASSGPISCAWPAHATGDYGLLFVESSNQAPGAVSGWAQIAQLGTAGPTTPTMLTIYSRFASSASEANASVPDSGDHTTGIIVVYRGVNTGAPIDASASGNGATTSIVLPAVTTTGDNRLIVHAIADGCDQTSSARYTGWANASLTSLDERADYGLSIADGGGIGVADGERVAAGTISAGAVTFALTASDYVAITLALRPV